MRKPELEPGPELRNIGWNIGSYNCCPDKDSGNIGLVLVLRILQLSIVDIGFASHHTRFAVGYCTLVAFVGWYSCCNFSNCCKLRFSDFV